MEDIKGTQTEVQMWKVIHRKRKRKVGLNKEIRMGERKEHSIGILKEGRREIGTKGRS